MTETSGQTYGFGAKNNERYLRLADESRRWFLGPMPPRDFLDAFLDVGKERAPLARKMPSPEGAFQAVPKRPTSEKAIYEPMVRDSIMTQYMFSSVCLDKGHE